MVLNNYTMLLDFSVEKYFDEIFKIYFRIICFFINKYTNDVEISKDIAQDIFLKLWNKREDFSSEMKVKAFLFISAKNASLNFIRSTRVRYKAVPAIIEKINIENDKYLLQEGITLANMIHAEFMNEIYRVIETLPVKRKQVIKLAYIEGMSNPNLAEYLKLSEHTIKEHKAIAMKFLRLKFKFR